MPSISRQVGTVSQNILVFIPNATVSTGAGLANIVASTVRITWLRSDMAAVSSWTMTSGTLGTWSTSTFTQVDAASTVGLYQVSLPHGLFASGNQAVAFLMSSTATMAPVPILIDLSTQVLAVSSLVGVSSITTPVGVTTGVVSVSAATIPFSVSSITTPVTVSAGVVSVSNATIPFGVSTGVVAVSAATIPFGVSSISTPVTASTAGVTSLSIPVSVSAGTVRVSAATIPFGVSSLSAAALRNFFDTGASFFSTAVVSSVVFEIATNVAATISGDVGVSAISIPVSVSSGSVRVTSASIPFGVSSVSIPVAVSAVTIPLGVSSSIMVSANIVQVNNVTVTGDGQVGTEWGP